MPVLVYVIHRLGPEGYGQWMMATAIVAACTILTNLGLRGAFIRAVAKDPSTARRALAEQLGVRALLAMLATLVAAAAGLLLGYDATVLSCLAVGSLGMLLSAIATTLSDLLQATHRLRTVAAVNLAAGLVLTGASLAAAAAGAGPVGLALSYLLGPAVALIACAVAVQRSVCPVGVSWSVASTRRLLHACRHFTAQQLLATCGAHAESLLLPRLDGAAAMGHFTAGSLLATRLSAFSDGLGTAAYPAMSRRFRDGRHDGAGLVLRLAAIAFVGGLVLAGAAALVAPPLGRVLFPADAGIFIDVALVTVWSLPAVGVEVVLGSAVNAAGEDAAQTRASVPAAIAGLAAAILLVAAWGPIGAAWSLLLRPIIRCLFLVPTCVRTFRRPAPLLAGGCSP